MDPSAPAEPAPSRKEGLIAGLSAIGIALHLLLRYGFGVDGTWALLPLYLTLLLGGTPLVLEIFVRVLKKDFGADLVAALSIVTAVVLGQFLAGAIVVLMLAGGGALELFALGRAADVLKALAKRMPSTAHRRNADAVVDVPLAEVRVGDILVVFPHETCPADGTVVEGHGTMDESYLTGEPFLMSKTPGAVVLSGAVNGETRLTLRADKLPIDSRYAKIMEVMRESEQKRPRLRRLGDRLGAVYTPLALGVALLAWATTGSAMRFLAVLVVATPCPLIIAIPVAIIGSVSLAAKRRIIIKNPAILEQIETCRTIIFDKTGTLTYGKPTLSEEICAEGFTREGVLGLAASLEQYSKHPLSPPIVEAARSRGLPLEAASEMAERAGHGIRGRVLGREVSITGRRGLDGLSLPPGTLPPPAPGLECVILVDGAFAALYRFRDRPREDSRPFVDHLGPKHRFERVMLVSGDRGSEVRYLAESVGISEVYGDQTPEAKARLVAAETARSKTLFLGDGINDAPALMAATVGVAFGVNSDVTAAAAGAVIMDSSLLRVDELFHIGRRLRGIALQSALGGMFLSLVGMGFAASGHLAPVAGAVAQEVIDVLAILNALRIVLPPGELSDYGGRGEPGGGAV